MRRLSILCVLCWCGVAALAKPLKIVVLISANAEWRVMKEKLGERAYARCPYGEYWIDTPHTTGEQDSVIYLHGGWGKVSAAATTEYAITRWRPDVVLNLGTCGGFAGSVQRFDVILVNGTVIYDIKEAMGDSQEAIRDYSTTIDLAWLNAPLPINHLTTRLVSADRDLVPAELAQLRQQYQAIAGDWESGAIAWVCQRYQQKLIILRGVSDLVSEQGGQAYGNADHFVQGTRQVMGTLLDAMPLILQHLHTRVAW